ncbi:MAG: hypothetical protein KDH96_02820 [Candidatus Riesia sp.]|nr:hypothetical protein [Candidatus Riesia sp.]
MNEQCRDYFEGCKVRLGKGLEYPIYVEDEKKKVILSVVLKDEMISKPMKRMVIKQVAQSLENMIDSKDLYDYDEVLLWYGAFHYYCGRTTISVSSFVDDLVKNWGRFSDKLRYLIQRDLEGIFEQDDTDRAEGRGVCKLGHDCDRLSWERVRKLYKVGD